MNYRFPREGNRATVMTELRNTFKRGDDRSNLGVTKLISLKIKVGFSTQSVNEKPN